MYLRFQNEHLEFKDGFLKSSIQHLRFVLRTIIIMNNNKFKLCETLGFFMNSS